MIANELLETYQFSHNHLKAGLNVGEMMFCLHIKCNYIIMMSLLTHPVLWSSCCHALTNCGATICDLS